jgi:membrane associated rhomboid family serine protease
MMNQGSFSPFAGMPPVVKNLLIINIICFIGTIIFDKANELFGVYYPDSPFFHVWQVVTYMFMHSGFAHLAFNMFALFSFGPVLEHILGSKRFLNFYFICGFGALFLQMATQAYEVYQLTGTFRAQDWLRFEYNMVYANNPLLTPDSFKALAAIYGGPMVGASGAIYGLLLAYAFLFPNSKLMLIFLPFPIAAKYFVPGLIALDLFFGITRVSSLNIAHFAHVGGALFGYIMLKVWRIQRPHFY